MGLETIGWGLARFANRFLGWWIKTIFERSWYFLDPRRQAGRFLGWALVADGATAEWLQTTLRAWESTGASQPTLLDLAAEAPNHGVTTQALIYHLTGLASWGAEGEDIDKRRRRYRNEVWNGRKIGRLLRDLCPNSAERWSMRNSSSGTGADEEKRRLQAEVARYAYDHILTLAPDAFEAACQVFSLRGSAQNVREAVQVGTCDRLGRLFGEENTDDSAKILANLAARPDLMRLLYRLFPEDMAAFLKAAEREAARERNARIFPGNYVEEDLSVLFPKTRRLSRAVRRGLKRVRRIGRTTTLLEKRSVVDLGLSPASAELLAQIVFPR